MDGVKSMRYFELDGERYAYDETQTDLITSEMVELTGDELNKLLNPPPPPVYLAPLTNRQFKLALLDAELLDDVELAISDIEDPTLKRRIQIEYEYATTFNRDSESIAVMVNLLNLSTNIVDEMWIKALTL